MYNVGIVGQLKRAHMAILHPQFNVRAVCDIREDQVARHLKMLEYECARLADVKSNGPIRGYTDFAQMLKKEKLDLVIDATPNQCHGAVSLAALEHGCHVVVEKPMCVSYEECDQLINAVRRTGLTLAVNHELRTTNVFHHLFTLRDDKKLGVPYYIRANYIHDKDSRLENPERRTINGFSPMMPFGCHPIDLILGLMDDMPEEVVCHAAKKRSSRRYPFPDTMSVAMPFKGGRIGYSLTVAAGRRPGAFHQFEMYATKMDVATAQLTNGAPTLIPDLGAGIYPIKMQFFRGRNTCEEKNFTDYPSPIIAACYRVYENLIFAIEQDVKPATMTDVIDGARVISVCLAAEESAATGKPVKPRNWEALSYRGAAAQPRETEYMKGYMRSHFLFPTERVRVESGGLAAGSGSRGKPKEPKERT